MKSGDRSREFLVAKLVCAKCGSVLKLSYPKERQSIPYVNGEPTGADKVDLSVHVWPCEKCYAPVEKVRVALACLAGIAEEQA